MIDNANGYDKVKWVTEANKLKNVIKKLMASLENTERPKGLINSKAFFEILHLNKISLGTQDK